MLQCMISVKQRFTVAILQRLPVRWRWHYPSSWLPWLQNHIHTDSTWWVWLRCEESGHRLKRWSQINVYPSKTILSIYDVLKKFSNGCEKSILIGCRIKIWFCSIIFQIWTISSSLIYMVHIFLGEQFFIYLVLNLNSFCWGNY